MSSPPDPAASNPTVFAFRGQTPQGATLEGTLQAPDAFAASGRLSQLGLRLLQITAVAQRALPQTLSGEQVLTFNDQLARLTAAGLPLEQGLRLVAGELQRGRLQHVVRDLADRLDRGEALQSAFEAHAHRFPPMYAAMLAAGARTGRLPRLLLECGQQEMLLQRLRRTLTRAMVYPLLVVLALIGSMTVISQYVVPQFSQIFEDFDTELPALTQCVLGAGKAMGPAAVVLSIVVAILLGLALIAWRGPASAMVRDSFWSRFPIGGAVLRHTSIARWCGAAALGVEAGMDLPAAFALAAGASGSTLLARDSEHLAQTLVRGAQLDSTARMRRLPATVVFTLQMGGTPQDLAKALRELSAASWQVADDRVNHAVDVVLPVTLVLVGVLTFFVVLGLFLPMVKGISSLT
jgi:type II secretory pathway component PulF